MPLSVETELEADGRWLAEIPAVPGALAYGTTQAEAVGRAQALALRVLADWFEAHRPPTERPLTRYGQAAARLNPAW